MKAARCARPCTACHLSFRAVPVCAHDGKRLGSGPCTHTAHAQTQPGPHLASCCGVPGLRAVRPGSAQGACSGVCSGACCTAWPGPFTTDYCGLGVCAEGRRQSGSWAPNQPRPRAHCKQALQHARHDVSTTTAPPGRSAPSSCTQNPRCCLAPRAHLLCSRPAAQPLQPSSALSGSAGQPHSSSPQRFHAATAAVRRGAAGPRGPRVVVRLAQAAAAAGQRAAAAHQRAHAAGVAARHGGCVRACAHVRVRVCVLALQSCSVCFRSSHSCAQRGTGAHTHTEHARA